MKIKVGLLGMGNVGTGTYKTLDMNREKIFDSTGLDIEITKVLVNDTSKDRGIKLPSEKLTQNPDDIFLDKNIDIVVELIGGIEPASEFMLKAMENGKHVVTANKAAVAANYDKLINTAYKNKVMLRYEASVGGGIPIINALTTALTSNDFEEILGIVNGTTNYIMTQMTEYRLEYSDVLKVAQEKGFAEADPTADVEGIDVANKLSILMAIVFGIRISPDDIPREGITKISKDDITFANNFGYKIKLLCTARKSDNKLECHVQPAFVPLSHPLASVSNEFNAVFVKGNAVDDLMFYGKGAGPLPTGSAVMGDIIEISSSIAKGSAFDSAPAKINEKLEYVGEGSNKYYVRLSVTDLPGTLGKISTSFGDAGISVQSCMQVGSFDKDCKTVPVIFILREVTRDLLNKTLDKIVSNHDSVEKVDSVISVID